MNKRAGERLREKIDAELARAQVRPDVDAVVRRARELDPELAVSDPSAAEVEPVVDDGTDGAALAPFVAALRGRIDNTLDERRLRPQPVFVRQRRPGVVAAVLALAAVVAIGIGIASVVDGDRLQGESGDAPRDLAGDLRDGKQVGGVAEPATPRPRDRGPKKAAVVPPSEVSPPPAETPEAAPTPPPPPEIEPTAARRPRARPKAPKQTLAERLADLDAKAQAAWRSGRRGEAEAAYKEIVARGGRRREAELAYGELFALTRRRGGDPAPLWRAYLRKFPRGRYADDAKAGLCRLATGSRQEACWEEYRETFPRGTHAPARETP